MTTTTAPTAPQTELFYSEQHQSWAVRYITDDDALGIAAGSEFLTALKDKDTAK